MKKEGGKLKLDWSFLKTEMDRCPVTDMGTVIAEYEGPGIALFNGIDEWDAYIGVLAEDEPEFRRWVLVRIDKKKWEGLKRSELTLWNIYTNHNRDKEIIILDQDNEDLIFRCWSVQPALVNPLNLPSRGSKINNFIKGLETRIGEKRTDWDD